MNAGRVALISGVSGGLGGAVTRAFPRAGFTVVGVARGAGNYVSADLTRPEGARAAVEEALRQAGRVDVLVHLMGGFAGGQPVEATDDATWQRMLDLNLNAAFYLCRAVLPAMKKAGWGRILTVGSRTGVEAAANFAAYGVSKAALIALTRTLALEGREHGITANVVLPSTIDTPANRAAMPQADATRWVKPEAIADLLVWLASEEAGEINGAVIPIYGRA